MNETTNIVRLRQPDAIDDPLTDILRAGARKLLAQAIEIEAEAYLASMRDLKLPDGRERLVRHGHGPERTIQTGIGPVEVSRVKIRDRGATGDADRIRFYLGDPAEMGAADEEPGCAAADPVPARALHRRLPGGARGPARQGRPEPLAFRDLPAHRRMAGRVRALAGAGSLGPPLRLCLGRRRLPAGPDGGSGRVHAGADRRHAGGQEGTGRLPGRRARERPELARTSRRDQAAGPVHPAPDRGRRRGARLLEGARRALSRHASSALLAAQDRQRAQQGAQVRAAGR